MRKQQTENMKKISTLFKKDPTNLGRVINEIDPANEWVFEDGVKATRKFDGTACAVIDGKLYRRYDAKPRYKRPIPEGAIPCQQADLISGHWPHWVPCDPSNPHDKYHCEAFKPGMADGTYELCGPQFQGNPEKLNDNVLIPHGSEVIHLLVISWDTIKILLENEDIEGIVFHHPDGRMCKIRKSDFGIKRDCLLNESRMI